MIFAEVEKRPRITTFDEFGPRLPSDRPPIKTPGELAIERGEPWPPPEQLPDGRDEAPVPVGAVSGTRARAATTPGPGYPAAAPAAGDAPAAAGPSAGAAELDRRRAAWAAGADARLAAGRPGRRCTAAAGLGGHRRAEQAVPGASGRTERRCTNGTGCIPGTVPNGSGTRPERRQRRTGTNGARAAGRAPGRAVRPGLRTLVTTPGLDQGTAHGAARAPAPATGQTGPATGRTVTTGSDRPMGAADRTPGRDGRVGLVDGAAVAVTGVGARRRSDLDNVEDDAAGVLPVPSFDTARAEAAVRELLFAVGEDPDRDGLRRTPRAGSPGRSPNSSPACTSTRSTVLDTSFDENHNEMILMRDIDMYSTCEHHLVPFFGKAHVGYIPGPDGRVTGLSKLARLVDGYAKRPQVQERLTTQIADALVRRLRAGRGDRGDRGRAPVHGDARHP